MDVEVLEHGEIAFLYRPRVETPVARGLEDVQRFFVALAPSGGRRLRRVAIGRKRLPDVARRQRFWGYVDRVADSPAALTADIEREAYWTKTRGLRLQPGPRLAGAGVYALARHGGHVHLAYALAHPGEPGPVQDELGIAAEASYIAAVLTRSLPRGLAAALGGGRWTGADPALLDVPGVELVLCGAAEDVRAELALDLGAREAGEARPLLESLRRERDQRATAPAFDGAWR